MSKYIKNARFHRVKIIVVTVVLKGYDDWFSLLLVTP